MSGPEQGSFVAFEMKPVNGGNENYGPAMFSVSVQSGNVEAERVFGSVRDSVVFTS